jgi:hypothetical protein
VDVKELNLKSLNVLYPHKFQDVLMMMILSLFVKEIMEMHQEEAKKVLTKLLESQL